MCLCVFQEYRIIIKSTPQFSWTLLALIKSHFSSMYFESSILQKFDIFWLLSVMLKAKIFPQLTIEWMNSNHRMKLQIVQPSVS